MGVSIKVCIYQVKPQKAEEFETLMLEAKSLLEKQEGLVLLQFAKRGIVDGKASLRTGREMI